MLCAHDPLTGIDHREERVQLLGGTILIVDSVFAARPGLADLWDIHIWLDVDGDVALERGVRRDADREGWAEAARLHRERYAVAESYYLAEVDVHAEADVIVGNTEIDRVRLVLDRLPHVGGRSRRSWCR